MTIIVIGAHGNVARRALPLLSRLSDDVRGVIRNPDHAADVEKLGATAVVADITALDAAGWKALLGEADTVIFSAGAGGGDPERTYSVDRDAAIAASNATNPAAHFIMVSYWGASHGDEIPESEALHHYGRAKKLADDHLRATARRYTILKPSVLTDGEAGEIRFGDESEADPGTTSREAVALLIARAAAEGPSGELCFVDG